MEIKYDKNRTIAVLELSSSAVKTLYKIPAYINKNKTDISRFDGDTYQVNLSACIQKKIIDIELFKANVLPIIEKRFMQLHKLNPQAFKVVATGYYRLAKNSIDIISLLRERFFSLSSKRYSIEVLKIEEEAFYGYLSWFITNKESENINLNNKICIYLDVGSSTTEIFVIRDFQLINGMSIPFGYFNISNILNAKNFVISTDLRKIKEENTKKYRRKVTNLIKGMNISFCVCTVSKLYTTTSSNDAKSVISEYNIAIENIIRILDSDTSEEGYPKYYESYVKSFTATSLLVSLFKELKIDTYYFNSAGLRYGIYHYHLEKLKNPSI